MNKNKIVEFLDKLKADNFSIIAPVATPESIVIRAVVDPSEISWAGDLPKNNFKPWLLPTREELMTFRRGQVREIIENGGHQVLFGMNILDLEALGLYEQVFAKDKYYLKRRQNQYVVGYSNGIEDDYRKYRVFHADYEENILEHRVFDVFIERQKNGNLKVFSGSEKGQRLLDDYGIDDYENIEFVGFIPESGVSKRILDLQARVDGSFAHAIWEEIGAKCIACGRCTIACPTCFCYDTLDLPEHDDIKRVRQGSSCFYNNFTEVAGGHDYLETVKKKIYYWYYHKFVRIPSEFSYSGCVSCMRCFRACPAEINIVKVLQELNKKNNEK